MHPSRRMLVQPLDKATIHEAGAVLSDSFWSYPEVVHLIPDEGRRQRVLARYLTADCVDALRVDSLLGAFHDGHLVGVAVCPSGVVPPPQGAGRSQPWPTWPRSCRGSCPRFAPCCELKR